MSQSSSTTPTPRKRRNLSHLTTCELERIGEGLSKAIAHLKNDTYTDIRMLCEGLEDIEAELIDRFVAIGRAEHAAKHRRENLGEGLQLLGSGA